MLIYQVQQVTVVKRGDAPTELLISAHGLTSTSGWTNPRLDNSADPNPKDAVLEFQFEADRPQGISLPVLTPITATIVVSPKDGCDAVIVSSRTNSVTVHASQFQTLPQPAPPTPGPTTFAIGEEMHPTTLPAMEEQFTTFMFGEETLTTLRLGEEGPWTTPLLDDPAGLQTTGAFGEDPGPFRPGGPGNPFGPFGRF